MSIKNGTAGGTTAEGLKEALSDAVGEATPIEKKYGERTINKLIDAYLDGKQYTKIKSKLDDDDKSAITKDIGKRYRAGEIDRIRAKNALMVLSGKSSKEADTYIKSQDTRMKLGVILTISYNVASPLLSIPISISAL